MDNHCVGHGPIRAGELIVVDIFPRRPTDGYWGDMTRTYLKGRASDAQRRLVRTVRKAHKMAIDMIKPGVTGGKVHDAVQAFFDKEGYETVRELFALWLASGICAADPERASSPPPSAASTGDVKNSKREDLEAALEKLKLPGVKINVKDLSVDVDAVVSLRTGLLELIACIKETKEHESSSWSARSRP